MDSRPCLNCGETIPHTRRADSKHCTDACRHKYQDRYFAGRRVSSGPQIYFVAGDGLIQIGLSSHLQTTMRCLRAQQGTLVPLQLLATKDGDMRHLAQLHRRFAHHRRHGRWFLSAPDILEYIRRNTRQF